MNKFTINNLSIIIYVILFCSSFTSAQWQKTNGIKGGYFYQVAGDEQNLLAVTNYGTVFHYSNGDWNFRSSSAYFSDIYMLGDEWIGYSSNSILRSSDDGITWQEILKSSNTNFLLDAKVIGNKIYAISQDSIFYSDNFGETWQISELNFNIVSGSDTGFIYAISSFYVKDNLLLASGFTTIPSSFEAIVYSTDMGTTWHLTNFPENIFNTFFFDITGDENFYYTSTSNGFFKSDNGIDWIEINNGLPFQGVSLSVSKINIYKNDLIAIINNDPSGLYRYNGTAWQLLYNETFPVYISTVNNDLILCGDGNVIKYDGINNPVLTSDIIASTSKPITSSNGAVYSNYRSNLYRTVDEGNNWEVIYEHSGALIVDNESVYTTSTPGIIKSSDMGNDWTTITSNIPASYVPKLSSIGLSDGVLYAGFNGVRPRTHLPAVWEQGGIFKSTNDGESWSPFNTGLPTDAGVPTPVYTITTNGNVVILYTASGRFSLINNSWVDISNGFPANTYVSNIEIFKDDIIFLTNNGLFISHDKGISKVEFNNGLPSLPYYYTILFPYEETIYIFSNDNVNNVYKLKGNEWILTDLVFPENLKFISLQSVDNILYAGTYDNGIWKFKPEITSSDDKLQPVSYGLAQNYPNPFNPATTVEYQLKTEGFVQLKIYDVLGNEVKTLVSEYKQAGEYKIEFDASSSNGGLTSGIYFYKLVTNNFTETKKMILLK